MPAPPASGGFFQRLGDDIKNAYHGDLVLRHSCVQQVIMQMHASIPIVQLTTYYELAFAEPK